MITRSRASCLFLAAGVAFSGCGRSADEIVIAYRLIVENQTRCQGLADDAGTVWGAAIRDGEDFDESLATFFSEQGAGRAAAVRVGLELIEERVREISTGGLGDQETRPLLLELYGAHSAACGLALAPAGRSLITFSATRAGLDDRFAVTESKLRVLLPESGAMVEEQLSTLRAA